MTTERLVLDTNVLISAALQPAGKPAAVLSHAIKSCELIFCEETWEEIASRLMRPKFDRLISRDARLELLENLHSQVDWVVISGARLGCRDPADDMFIEAAIVGRADCIVTGDRDLLDMRPAGADGLGNAPENTSFQGIMLLRPAEFLLMALG